MSTKSLIITIVASFLTAFTITFVLLPSIPKEAVSSCEERFDVTYDQRLDNTGHLYVLTDKKTGNNYLLIRFGEGMHVTLMPKEQGN